MSGRELRVAGVRPGEALYLLWRRYRRVTAVRRLFYGAVARLTMGQSDWGLMNFGYAEPEDDAPGEPVPEPGVALYERVRGGVALAGRSVLDIGCGRGGGSRHLARRHRPARLVGLDFAPGMIAFCRRGEPVPGLEFRVGDACDLPFADREFDAVFNVESSHCYPDKVRFLREVHRVLAPGGTFHYADAFGGRSWESRRRALLELGFVVEQEEDVTPGVLRAMDADAARRRRMIERLAPRPFRNLAAHWAGLPGSEPYQRLRDGASRYVRCVARRSA